VQQIFIMTTPQAEKIYTKIKQLVIERFEPGAPLQEMALAQSLGSSRTPVREALSRLLAEGFVERVPNRGYTVARITIKQLRDMFEIRRLIEGEVAARAARFATPTDLEKMRKLAPYRFKIVNSADYRKAMETNEKFHLSIAEAGRNACMADLVKDCLHKMDRFLRLGVRLPKDARKATHEEHMLLVEAIAKKDGEEARRIVHQHLDRTMELQMKELLQLDVGVTAS
jgi:DNA-binding GntR family transcriptional regulator